MVFTPKTKRSLIRVYCFYCAISKVLKDGHVIKKQFFLYLYGNTLNLDFESVIKYQKFGENSVNIAYHWKKSMVLEF